MRRLMAVVAVLGIGITIVSCQASPAVPGATALAAVGKEQPTHVYCRFVALGSPVLPLAQTPEAMRDFWDARLAYEHRALVASPSAIVADWAMVVAFTRDDLTPSIKALGYARIPTLREPDVVTRARVRIAIVDAGCDSPVT